MKGLWTAVSAAVMAGVCLSAVAANAQGCDEDVDPVADLAGLVLADETNQGTLYTTAEEQVEVLDALGAVPVGLDHYAVEMDGDLLEVDVTLTPLPALYLPDDATAAAKPKGGKVYRNARCVPSTPAITSPCAGYNFQWAIVQTQPIARCKKGGTQKCVERKKVVWTRFIFSDPACTNLIGLQSRRKLSCQ